MDCQIAGNLLQELLDGGLGASENREVQGHLGTCASCSARYENLRFIARSLRDLPLYRVSPGFDREVLSALELSPAPLPTKWAAWSKGSLLLLISGWMTTILSVAVSYLGFLKLARVGELLLHPSRLSPFLEIGLAKVSLSLIQLVSAGQGLLEFLTSGVVGPILLFQIGFSSLLAGSLIVLLSRNKNKIERWRTA